MSGVTSNGVFYTWDEYKELNKKVKTKKTLTPSEILIERLRTELGYQLSPKAKVVQLNTSRQWRRSGRWAWEIKDPDSRYCLGSDTGIRDLYKAKYLIVCHTEGGRILGYEYRP